MSEFSEVKPGHVYWVVKPPARGAVPPRYGVVPCADDAVLVKRGYRFAVVDRSDHRPTMPLIENCCVIALFPNELDADSYCDYQND